MKEFIVKIKNLSVGVKASFVYTCASLLSKGLAIISVPIFTRLMSSEQMGIVNLFSSWQSMIGSVATLSLASGGYAVAMHEYEAQRDKYMSSILTLTSFVAIMMLIVYMVSPDFWNTLLNLPSSLMILMLVGFFVSPATDFWLLRQRYEYKYVMAGIITISSAVLASVISVISIVIATKNNVKNLGVIRLISNYGVIYIVAAVLWVYIMVKGKSFIQKKYWIYSLKLSVPLIGNSVAMQVLSVSDRTMISKMVGNSAVGIYSVLYTVSSLSLLIWNAINSSFIPFLFENINKRESEKMIKKISYQLMIAYSVVAIVMTLVAPEIVKILATNEYYEAIYIMPPIAAGVFLTSISNMYANILIYYKKTKYIMISSMTAAFLNVILNYIFINIWGYKAAAYTTLFAYTILAIIQGITARKICGVIMRNSSIYDDGRLLILSTFTIACCLLCLTLYSHVMIRCCVILFLTLIIARFRRKILEIFTLKN